jgi:hypothetical protein
MSTETNLPDNYIHCYEYDGYNIMMTEGHRKGINNTLAEIEESRENAINVTNMSSEEFIEYLENIPMFVPTGSPIKDGMVSTPMSKEEYIKYVKEEWNETYV